MGAHWWGPSVLINVIELARAKEGLGVLLPGCDLRRRSCRWRRRRILIITSYCWRAGTSGLRGHGGPHGLRLRTLIKNICLAQELQAALNFGLSHRALKYNPICPLDPILIGASLYEDTRGQRIGLTTHEIAVHEEQPL